MHKLYFKTSSTPFDKNEKSEIVNSTAVNRNYKSRKAFMSSYHSKLI